MLNTDDLILPIKEKLNTNATVDSIITELHVRGQESDLLLRLRRVELQPDQALHRGNGRIQIGGVSGGCRFTHGAVVLSLGEGRHTGLQDAHELRTEWIRDTRERSETIMAKRLG